MEIVVGSQVQFRSKTTGTVFAGIVYFNRPEINAFGIDEVSRTNAFQSRMLVEGCYQFSVKDIEDLRVISDPALPISTTMDTEKDDQNNNPGDASSSSTLPSEWVSCVKYLQTKNEDVQGSLSYRINMSDSFNPTEYRHEILQLLRSQSNDDALLAFQIAFHLLENGQNQAFLSIVTELLPTPMIETPLQVVQASIFQLPRDITLVILARVPKSKYPLLSCVSKALQETLGSEIHNARRSLDTDRSYYCFSSRTSTQPLWFTLRANKERPAEDVFAPAFVLSHGHKKLRKFFSFGREIVLVCGGSKSQTTVCFFDTRSSSLREVSLPVPMGYRNAAVSGNTLHVFGNQYTLEGLGEPLLTRAVSLDLKSQAWTGPSRSPVAPSWRTASVDEKIYVFMWPENSKCYNPKDGSYTPFQMPNWFGYEPISTDICVMDNVMFVYNTRRGLHWYNTKTASWKEVLGSSLRNITGDGRGWIWVAMTEYYGLLTLLWEDKGSCWLTDDSGSVKVWCTKITLQRDLSDFHGEVGPHQLVGSLPSDYLLFDSVSVIL